MYLPTLTPDDDDEDDDPFGPMVSPLIEVTNCD